MKEPTSEIPSEKKKEDFSGKFETMEIKEIFPIASIKSKNKIVIMDGDQFNSYNNNDIENSSKNEQQTSENNKAKQQKDETYNEDKIGLHSNLQAQPSVIPDDKKDSPKSSDTSKGSNETL